MGFPKSTAKKARIAKPKPMARFGYVTAISLSTNALQRVRVASISIGAHGSRWILRRGSWNRFPLGTADLRPSSFETSARLSSSLMSGHIAISSIVRKHPMQTASNGSMRQTLMQGE